MSNTFKLKKGFDIKLIGTPEHKYVENFKSSTFAVKPPNYIGIKPIPKLTVAIGDEVIAGDQIFFDKSNPDMAFCSPVSGEVVEIRRGAKRAITEVVILADDEIKFKNFGAEHPDRISEESIVAKMLQSGCWPLIRQRPFNIIADPTIKPRDIFISCFDTNPLAPDLEFTLRDDIEYFQTGIDVLDKLTEGNVYLGLNGKLQRSIFSGVKKAKLNSFTGPHPAGNVGVQIHHVNPINKGDIVWTVHPYNVVAIGRLFQKGIYDTSRMFTIGGPPVDYPANFKSYLGTGINYALENNLKTDNVRVIGGSPLSGEQLASGEHLGAFDYQISVLEEGDFSELFGWILPSYSRPSISPTLPAVELTSKVPFVKKVEAFNANTNTHGEKRAFVMSGQYEKVLPMDILPVQLLKAILSNDFDLMEGLGIYELVEEDLALCEFVCTSKFDVQDTLREGLNIVREQG